MQKYLALLLILVAFSCSNPSPDHLFKVTVNNKVGYIDHKGNMVIKPVYHAGGNFEEGLAPVRLDGLYGFINIKGEWVIEPKYEYAEDFHHGLAKVYKKEHSLFINRKGEEKFTDLFYDVSFLTDHKAIVSTFSGKYGVMDLIADTLLVDTVFYKITATSDGLAITQSLATTDHSITTSGLIDSSGKTIISAGTYNQIGNFLDGYSLVHIGTTDSLQNSTWGLINTKGELQFSKTFNRFESVTQSPGNGFISVYTRKPSALNDHFSSLSNTYIKILNHKGETVLDDTSNLFITQFSKGRAFINKGPFHYILVNKSFKPVTNQIFEYPDNKTCAFDNGYANVTIDHKNILIDTNGVSITADTIKQFHYSGAHKGGYYFFSQNPEADTPVYSMARAGGRILTAPVIQEIDNSGFKNGLLQVMMNKQVTYLDTTGKIIWQEPARKDSLYTLNVDYMLTAYCRSASSHTEDEDNYRRGYASCDNYPERIRPEQNIQPGQLQLFIDTTSQIAWNETYRGYKLFVFNASKSKKSFKAANSVLQLILQAKDESGEWKDIEGNYRSWCGNSYHTLQLLPGEYWSFTVPQYQGTINTQLRACLTYFDPSSKESYKNIYSNSFRGSVNPGQFWPKSIGYSGNLMDSRIY